MAALSFLRLAAAFASSLFKSKHQLVLENLALQQQVPMLRLSVMRSSSCKLSTKQPTALDEPVDSQAPQGLPSHRRRRVRRVRRVEMEFY
jgi:hypothetical protein